MGHVLMVPLSLRLALATALCMTDARAQSPEPSVLAATQAPSHSTTQASAPSVASGDLVELAKQPEAELLVQVKLSGSDPKARYEIRSTLSDAVLLACPGECEFRIWPGRYRLLTFGADREILGEEPILIDRDSRISVASPGKWEKVLGGLITAAGTIAFISGAAIFQSNACDTSCTAATARNNRLGLGVVLAGAVTIPVGILILRHGTVSAVTLTFADPAESGETAAGPSRVSRGVSWSVAF